MIELLLMPVSLALDAFAVSVSSGISVRGFTWRHALLMGLWFGAFQFIMPVLGYLLGSTVAPYIIEIDHWVAFGLLALIGGRMCLSGLKGGQASDSGAACAPALTPARLTVLAVATSIDALAIGVSMVFMDVNIWLSAALIGVVAFVLSVLGGLFGRQLGGLAGRWSELFGGAVLIGIGVHILVEHLC